MNILIAWTRLIFQTLYLCFIFNKHNNYSYFPQLKSFSHMESTQADHYGGLADNAVNKDKNGKDLCRGPNPISWSTSTNSVQLVIWNRYKSLRWSRQRLSVQQKGNYTIIQHTIIYVSPAILSAYIALSQWFCLYSDGYHFLSISHIEMCQTHYFYMLLVSHQTLIYYILIYD